MRLGRLRLTPSQLAFLTFFEIDNQYTEIFDKLYQRIVLKHIPKVGHTPPHVCVGQAWRPATLESLLARQPRRDDAMVDALQVNYKQTHILYVRETGRVREELPSAPSI